MKALKEYQLIERASMNARLDERAAFWASHSKKAPPERADEQIEAFRSLHAAAKKVGPVLGYVASILIDHIRSAESTVVSHKIRLVELYDEVAELRAQIAALQGRAASVQARSEPELPVMRYTGVWKSDREYRPGEVATHAGTIWHCGIPTRTKPGTSPDWQMMAKSPDRARVK
jgi:hypothetical protein